MKRMKLKLKEGDIFKIYRHGDFVLCHSKYFNPPALRELPARELTTYQHPDVPKDIFNNLEGKVGLIVYVARNRLDQPLGYRVLIEGHEMFCKSNVADKYFKLMETKGDESR